MKYARIIFALAYLLMIGLVVLAACLAPQAKTSAIGVAIALSVYGLLSQWVMVLRMSDAGRIGAWSVHGIASFITIIIGVGYILYPSGLWLWLTALLLGVAVLVTITWGLLLKPDTN